MRKAMPSSIGLWADSFVESMNDNKTLMLSLYELIDQLPLGTGAGYGLPIKVDRIILAKLLNFRKIQANPIYVQNSRGKFESSILHTLSQIMFDLNKMSSDIILFSMPEFGYFELSTNLCTGSSIMPQKRNPDVLEIIRANYHQLIAYEFEVKNIVSNLISGYNRDLQLTKEPVINGFELTKNTLCIMKLVMEKVKVNSKKCKKAMTRELYATGKAYELIKKGVPFREAYQEISKQYD
jgi:argininosuccinate lyase